MFQFPFGTMHQLNLDWFLQQWQQLRQDWIDEEQHIEDSMQDVYDARDAAIQAKDDAVAAKNDAESAQAGVHADALMAEGFAVGEQGGTPVGPGSPYYQVNAKFYSTNAGTYRYLSEAYARGTMGGTPVDPGDAGYEDNAKYYKEQADLDAQSASDDAAFAAADALKAEGYAIGEQNGVPVSSGDPYYQDNAKYYAAEAQQDKDDADAFKDAANQAALRAEGYSSGTQNGTPVGSGSPYYENNAYYYFANTANIDGENAQKMIAGEEATTTLSQDYPSGSYIRVAGVLYRTFKDLSSGDTLSSSNSVSNVKVCDELIDLNNDGGSYALYNDLFNKKYNNTVNHRNVSVFKNHIRVYGNSSSSTSTAMPIMGKSTTRAFNFSTWSGSYLQPDDFVKIPETLYDFSIALLVDPDADADQGSNGGICIAVYTYDEITQTVETVIAASANNQRRSYGKQYFVTNLLTTYPRIRETGNFYILPVSRLIGSGKLQAGRIILESSSMVNNPALTDYVEIKPVATRNYSVNDIFRIGSFLYIATSNISSGSNIVTGTNATRVALGQLITQILNQL